MASWRALKPLASRTPSLIQRATIQPATRRFLNTETAPALYTAHANVTGGRASGHAKADNLDVQLGQPKQLGGPGGKTNPEELFAAGYGACFQSAMGASAGALGIKLPQDPKDNVVESTVNLVGDLKKLDLGLRVNLKVKLKGISKADAEKVLEKTKEVCPYSRATKGNVATNVELEIM